MTKRRVAILTGSRAEFSLLTPVIRAIEAHPDLEALVMVAGSHLVPPAVTKRDVEALFPIAAEIPMQSPGVTGRIADARALAWGISGVADAIEKLRPDWLIVLGDRIEALAGAAASSIGGVALAHIHGGDRAEGVADDAMRHAITKLAHVHFAATAQSADRIIRMGEDPARVHTVGSPSIDALTGTAPLADAPYKDLGSPDTILLLHPVDEEASVEGATAEACIGALAGRRVLWMAPNGDPGRDAIERVRAASARTHSHLALRDHLPAPAFRSLVARLGRDGGVIVGNSSGALIECAALRCPAVDVGPRQAHRERGTNTVRVDHPTIESVREAVGRALAIERSTITHPFGDGCASARIARVVAEVDPHSPTVVRKVNAY